jgi:hypothetical protein
MADPGAEPDVSLGEPTLSRDEPTVSRADAAVRGITVPGNARSRKCPSPGTMARRGLSLGIFLANGYRAGLFEPGRTTTFVVPLYQRS